MDTPGKSPQHFGVEYSSEDDDKPIINKGAQYDK
jgi:hypothetical protein